VEVSLWLWVGVLGFIAVALALDLFVLHREAHEVSMSEAALTSGAWMVFGLGFAGIVWAMFGADRAGEYLAGYLIEKSLSVDNIFVFALIFAYFGVPAVYQHRLLFWGALGALLFRAAFIAAGAALLENFHWMIYVFGGFLVVTGVRMGLHRSDAGDPGKNPVLRAVRRLVPMADEYRGQRFFLREGGKWIATPLFAVLIAIETTDVVFAVDSIPAIFAVTEESFLVFTSNAFAILGLRALYFLLAGMVTRFSYLKLGLAVVLVFVGFKMLLTDLYKIPVWTSLAVIGVILGLAIGISWRRPLGTVQAQHR
jgi:tellurite resistance protein TerC